MFGAMVKKEFLLVLRDKHALMALFVMPALFILIMSVALRDKFAQEHIAFDIVVIDKDNSAYSKALQEKLQKDGSFHLLKKPQNAQFVVTIPKDYYALMKKRVALKILVKASIKSDLLEIFKSKLLRNVVAIEVKEMDDEMKRLSLPQPAKKLSLDYKELFEISYEKSNSIPTSTQQSVPSWIVFGMFFVIIPMSTIFINERKQNTLTRLSSMNVSLISMVLSKIIPYIVINQIQVWIMLGVGIFIVPLFDTPALVINGSIGAIVLLSFALSISAIGLSTLLAVSASSAEQATTIGGILNILLGAIGGVMVPKFIMPQSMQTLSQISPMSWGLDGFLDIFMRSGDAAMVFGESAMLFLFGLITLIISMIILHIRINRGL
jgi:ABC-2 type transport system permease protein